MRFSNVFECNEPIKAKCVLLNYQKNMKQVVDLLN